MRKVRQRRYRCPHLSDREGGKGGEERDALEEAKGCAEVKSKEEDDEDNVKTMTASLERPPRPL